MKNDDWKQDLYRYRLTPSPPKKDDFQEYIALYFAEKDEKYLSWFLHYYEPILNTQAMSMVQEYSMRGHFMDMKQAAVYGILILYDRFGKASWEMKSSMSRFSSYHAAFAIDDITDFDGNVSKFKSEYPSALIEEIDKMGKAYSDNHRISED